MRATLSRKGRGEASVAPHALAPDALSYLRRTLGVLYSRLRAKTRCENCIAFSSEVGTGSREENASHKKVRKAYGNRIFCDSLASAGVRAERGARLLPAGPALAL